MNIDGRVKQIVQNALDKHKKEVKDMISKAIEEYDDMKEGIQPEDFPKQDAFDGYEAMKRFLHGKWVKKTYWHDCSAIHNGDDYAYGMREFAGDDEWVEV